MDILTGRKILASLESIGWSPSAITREAGINYVTILNLRNGKAERITSKVSDRLKELFEKVTLTSIDALADGPLVVSDAMPSPPAKKKPGRKPKARVHGENADQPPKKRGRPKKDVSDAPKVLKKRGRPAREAVEAESVAEKPAVTSQEPAKTQSDHSKMIKADGTLDLAMLNSEIERLKHRVRDLENAKAAYFDLLAMLQ
jgi:hypothetical protein